MKKHTLLMSLTLLITLPYTLNAEEVCQGYGPQSPRDISQTSGQNTASFVFAPDASDMNLCNIHTHTNAEHKAAAFSVFAGDAEHGGYRCNNTDELTEAELSTPEKAMTYGHISPGDTLEVHWVYTTCDVEPGSGLGSCFSDACQNPQLRVESQVFLLVNDSDALDFNEFTYDGNVVDGRHQAKRLPENSGEPVLYAGSTTGTKYTQSACSPYEVTWSVRPQCAKLDINSLNAWAEKGSVFEEEHSHGVRQLVTEPSLLSEIK